MKTSAFFLAMTLITTTLSAVELNSESPLRTGSFHGGLSLKITRVLDENSVFVGGQVMFWETEKISLGGAGYGLSNEIDIPGAGNSSIGPVGIGYGGVAATYSERLLPGLELAGSLLVGGGGVGIETVTSDEYKGDGFLVVEPGLDLRISTANSIQVVLGLSYRGIAGLELNGMDESDLSGISSTLSVNFGRF